MTTSIRQCDPIFYSSLLVFDRHHKACPLIKVEQFSKNSFGVKTCRNLQSKKVRYMEFVRKYVSN